MGKIIALYVAIGALVLLDRIAFGLARGGRPLGPPRPVARRFLTSREAAMADLTCRVFDPSPAGTAQ